MKKYYYFIEDLDVTDDNIPDGVLVRQFLIDRKNNFFIYTKNNYLSKEMLEQILEDIIKSSHKSSVKPILVPKKTINAIKNKMVDIDEIPRVILSKTSVFAHLIHNKQIDMKILIRDLNKIFS
jgi:hypothetical protein